MIKPGQQTKFQRQIVKDATTTTTTTKIVKTKPKQREISSFQV